MTTAKSPPHKLRAQAHKIATQLKQMAAGGPVPNDPLGKIAASMARGELDFAIVMDDKILSIKVPWKTIENLTPQLLCDFIFDQMSEAKREPN